MSDQSPFGGASLFDLFKMEAESHGAALSDGLLAWERTPDDRGLIEPLMRAAHSIKGAARIVGLDAIVPLAHAMEDCFVAAGNGREPLSPGRVDQLLRCVDLIAEVRSVPEVELPRWAGEQASRVQTLVAALTAPPPPPDSSPPAAPHPAQAVDTHAPAPPAHTPVPASPAPIPTAPSSPRDAAPQQGGSAAHVRVSSNSLNRMLFLAGESTVEISRLQAIRTMMASTKTRERAFEVAMSSLKGKLNLHHGNDHDQQILACYEGLVSAADSVHSSIADQTRHLEHSLSRIEQISGALSSEVVRSRMRPFSEGTSGFQRMVRDIARELGKEVVLQIVGEAVHVDRDILQKLESPLTHLIRNSLDHGAEIPAERLSAGKPRAATISLIARHQGGSLVIEVRDDGRGIDPEDIRRKVIERGMVDEATASRLTRAELMEMLFLPGFTTKSAVSEISGRGVGLDVVQSMVQAVSGTVSLESEPGKGARFLLVLPVTRSVVRAIIVKISGEYFALPLARLDHILIVHEDQVVTVQGRAQFAHEGFSIGLVWANEVFGLAGTGAARAVLPVVVIGAGDDRCGLVVDEICGEEDLVVRPLDARLGVVPQLAAATIRSDGTPVLVIDLDDVWRSVKESLQSGRPLGLNQAFQTTRGNERRRVLVVDDSITVREVERQLLQRAGFDVSVAVDGKDGFNMLRTGRFDLLVTDVDMPRMTGIELVRAVRRDPKLADLPVIIVSYKDREEDRLAGLEAGASAYLTKSSFQDDSLIRMANDLAGASN